MEEAAPIKTYLTAQGLKKLEDEYKELKDKKIPVIAQRIDEAKQQGDLSENAEYHSAREEMAWAQTRLAELEQILNNVEVISAKSASKIIQLGSSISVETDGGTKEFTIVGAQEADPANGFISNESPLGKSFLGHLIGDIIIVNIPKGVTKYKILQIR